MECFKKEDEFGFEEYVKNAISSCNSYDIINLAIMINDEEKDDLAKERYLRKLEEELIKRREIPILIKFLNSVSNRSKKPFDQVIIEESDVVLKAKYVNSVAGCNEALIRDSVIATKNSSEIVEYAVRLRKISEASLVALEDEVVKSENSAIIYLFLKNVRVANKKRLIDALVTLGDKRYLFEAALYVDDSLIERTFESFEKFLLFALLTYKNYNFLEDEVTRARLFLLAENRGLNINMFIPDFKPVGKKRQLKPTDQE